MYSFYGGKEGRTYNLVAHYDSIYQMVRAFQYGAANTDAKYNEYVIIDTIVNRNDKTDPENGIIYRRGLNFNEKFDPQNILAGDKSNSLSPDDTIEITLKGQIDQKYTDETIPETGTEIVWPVPRFKHYEYYLRNGDDGLEVELHPGELIVDETDTPLFNIVWKNFVTNPGGGAEYVGQVVGPQGESPLTQLVDWDTFEEEYLHNVDNTEPVKGELLASRRPGYDGTEYNDDIKYGYCNVRDAQGNVYGAILSMDLPYTVFKFEFESGSAYGPVTRPVSTYQDLPSEAEVDKNVYYHVEDEDKYYIWDDTRKITTVVNEVENEIALETIPLIDINFKQLYYTLDDNLYHIAHISSVDNQVEWEQVDYTSYLSDPGYVETELWLVENSDQEPSAWKYINVLREYADSQNHNFYKHYNIQIPKGIHGVNFEGFNEVNSSNEYYLQYYLRTFDDYDTKETGTIIGPEPIGTLKVIKDTEILSGTSENPISWIRINYFTKDQNNQYEYDDLSIKRIEKIELTDAGILQVTYVDGNTINVDPLNDANNLIRTVTQIGIENDRDLAGQKTFYYQYDKGNIDPEHPTHIPMGTLALNEIVDVQLVGNNLAVLYSDAALRQQIYDNGNGQYYKLPYEGTLWNATTPDTREGNIDYFYWANLGPSIDGEHIFGHFDSPEQLRQEYPNGFGTDLKSEGRQGWIATVTSTIGGQSVVSLYAYDYNQTHDWYEISSIAENTVDPRIVMIIDQANGNIPLSPSTDSKLLTNGYWFVSSDIEVATEL